MLTFKCPYCGLVQEANAIEWYHWCAKHPKARTGRPFWLRLKVTKPGEEDDPR